MVKKITIRDVAREAGVSVTLVSFVMNAKVDENGELDCPVNADTAERVLQVAKRLGYKRNNAAASLRSGKTNTIAVIVSDIASPFFAGLCRYLENTAYEAGYTVLFASSEESVSKLGNLIDKMIGFNVEGLIVAPCVGSEKVLSRVDSYNIPTVLIDRDIPGEDFGRVLVDNTDAGYRAARYLIDKGRKKIELVSYDLEIASVADRVEGYRKAMAESGLEARVDMLPYAAEPWSEEVVSVFREAIGRGAEGFILPTKKLSKSALHALKALGAFPKDLVCYDESDVYDLLEGGVPHMVQPVREIAERAFDLLLKIINNEPADKKVLLQSGLFIGRTPYAL